MLQLLYLPTFLLLLFMLQLLYLPIFLCYYLCYSCYIYQYFYVIIYVTTVHYFFTRQQHIYFHGKFSTFFCFSCNQLVKSRKIIDDWRCVFPFFFGLRALRGRAHFLCCDFTVLHHVPAAHQDHCDRWQTRTRGTSAVGFGCATIVLYSTIHLSRLNRTKCSSI